MTLIYAIIYGALRESRRRVLQSMDSASFLDLERWLWERASA